MTKRTEELDIWEAIDHARDYLASMEKSLVNGKKTGAKQTANRVISYVKHAKRLIR
jgi:hypothetical protein